MRHPTSDTALPTMRRVAGSNVLACPSSTYYSIDARDRKRMHQLAGASPPAHLRLESCKQELDAALISSPDKLFKSIRFYLNVRAGGFCADIAFLITYLDPQTNHLAFP